MKKESDQVVNWPRTGTVFAVLVSTTTGPSMQAGRIVHQACETSTMPTKKTDETENGAIKDPHDWTTGDEPMTGAQDSYLHTLARKAGEEVGDDLTKAEASIKIEELREKTGVENPKPKGKTS
jgi:hypothetical protein